MKEEEKDIRIDKRIIENILAIDNPAFHKNHYVILKFLTCRLIYALETID